MSSFLPLKSAFLLLLLVSVLSGQEQSDTALLREIERAYNELNFTEAEIKAETALENYERFKGDELTQIHKILGLIYFSQNRQAEARTQFENALSLSPDLELDSLMVSPKIMEFFNQVKTDFTEARQNTDAPSQVRYVLVSDPRPAAAMRSMVLPGWGQLYKGEQRKGIVLLSMWTVGIVGSVVTHIARNDARDDYLAATNPAQIESRFDRFDTLHKLRNNLLLFSAGVWLFSYFDAILKHDSSQSGERPFSVSPAVSVDRARLLFSWRF